MTLKLQDILCTMFLFRDWLLEESQQHAGFEDNTEWKECCSEGGVINLSDQVGIIKAKWS